MKKTESTAITDHISLLFLATVKNMLLLFTIGDAPSSSSSTDVAIPPGLLPEPADAIDLIQAMLPKPIAVFMEEFFHRSLYGLATLYKAAELFGVSSISEIFMDSLGLSIRDQRNCLIKLFVCLWFLWKLTQNSVLKF